MIHFSTITGGTRGVAIWRSVLPQSQFCMNEGVKKLKPSFLTPSLIYSDFPSTDTTAISRAECVISVSTSAK